MNRSQLFGGLMMLALLLFAVGGSAEILYHQIMVPMPSQSTVLELQAIGCDLECGSKMIKGEGLLIVVDELELSQIRERGIPHIVTISDMAAHDEQICLTNLEKIPSMQTLDHPTHMKYGTMGGFYNFQEIIADLDSMRLLYPDLVAQKVILGYGWDENPIYMVKISDNVNINEDEPEALFDALHHAREPGSYTSMIYSMWYLLENYGTDPEVTYLIDNRELFFVPVVNPDGLLYNEQTNPYGGGYWRKNRRDNGSSYGVDLNRNYVYQWGYDNYGSSGTPTSSTYRGPEPASEPETQAMITFIEQHDFTTAMTVHTASGVYVTAYGYADVPPEHYDTHFDYMAFAAEISGYSYGTCYDIMYASNGRTQDHQLHFYDIINVEPEVGEDGFWPSIQYILPEAEDQLNCYFNQFWCAGGQVIFGALNVVDGFLDPGATEELVLEVFNRGWGESEAITFELTTTDPYVTLNAGTVNVNPIPRYSGADNSGNPFTADISPNAPIGHTVDFTVTIDQGGYIRTENVSLSIGTPVIYFSDNAEGGTGNWSLYNGWGTDNTQQHGGNFSFNESPYGNYSNNLTARMTLASPLNLSGLNSCWLDFWARWDIESNYDFCQVEVSTNGSTWIPLAGMYTVAGSGIGVQTTGEPGYEGSQGTWVHENIDLTAYAGQSSVWFRFEFKSDGGVVGNGFFVDDIQVLGFGGEPPVGEVSVDLTYVSGSPVPSGGGNLIFDVYVLNYGST
ncbi:immune inhibitor A, partial [bacterium]|nr:immune inhibitor A [bacterium]